MAEHKKRVREASNNDSDDDDYIDDDNSEYEVEKVVSHRKVNGKLEYQVKWAGWDDSYNEWISEDGCNCTDLMQEYWSSKDSASRPSNYANSRAVGVGTSSSTRFRNTAKSTNTRRPMNGPGSGGPPFSQSGQPKKQRKEEDLDDFREIKDGSYPPAGTDWEKEVGRIAGMGRYERDGDLLVCLVWRDGNKTMHTTKDVYAKCPQKMLRFYEKFIKFVRVD